MAIVGIILAILVGIGFMIGVMQMFGGMSSYFGEAFIIFVQKLFLLLAAALPLIIAVVIFYIAIQKEKMEIMVFGSIYAMLLLLLTLYTGIYTYVSDLFYSSMVGFNASWFDFLKPLKELFVAFAFFIVGVFNQFIENMRKFHKNLKAIWKKARKPGKRR